MTLKEMSVEYTESANLIRARNINLTTQSPVITVQGQNTGNTAEDRQNLANTLRDILLEQTASGSVRTTAQAF